MALAHRLPTWPALAAAALLLTGQAPAAPVADRVSDLTAVRSCRSLGGATLRLSGTRTGDGLTVIRDVHASSGDALKLEDRYRFDAARGVWNVDLARNTALAFTGTAPPWTGATWTVEGRSATDVPVRMTDELLPGGDLRVTLARGIDGGFWRPFAVERCTAGETPPSEDACIAEDYPAATLYAAQPDLGAMKSGPTGTVYVIVHLNAASEVESVKVQSSPAPILNAIALDAARRSIYRTEIRDCKPRPADYLFAVGFNF